MRILPSLIAVLFVSAAIAWALFYRNELPQFGSELIGGSLFTANFVLWKSGGYFALQSKPLLHLWSLAVEEQFYLIWPPVVIIAARLKWNRLGVITGLLAASFIANIAMLAASHSDAAFYLPFSRLWEILCGTLLVEIVRRKGAHETKPRRRHVFSIAGGALLIAGFAIAQRFQWWPGFGALLPVAGTVLIIAAGPHAILNRTLLSRRLVVVIGLISYPLYLWHWPLLVFYKTIYEGSSPAPGRALTLLIAFVLSAYTFRFVESPIRFGKNRKRSAVLLLIPLAMLAITGMRYRNGEVHGRLGSHFDKERKNLGMAASYFADDDHIVAVRIPGRADARVLVIGDSHAGQYLSRARYLAAVHPGTFPTVVFITYGGCGPFRHLTRTGVSWDGKAWRCPKIFRTSASYAARTDVKTIVIVSYWEQYSHAGEPNFHDERAIDAPWEPRSEFADLAAEIREWSRAGKSVYVINSNPTRAVVADDAAFPPRLFGITHKNHHVMTRKEIDDNTRAGSQLISSELARAGAIVINPIDYLCTSTVCPDTTNGGAPIYQDKDHLGQVFVQTQASFIDPVFATTGRQK